MRLLESGDPEPVLRVAGDAGAPFLIICDHAGRKIPAKLGALGLPAEALERHIAWDIGALDLSRRLGEALGATVIAQAYSRLVIDCNRAPGRADAIVEVSDGQVVPGNLALSPEAAVARWREVHAPYHAAIAAELDGRAASGAPPPVLLAVHSFTPRMNGRDRPWHFGVLHDHPSPYSARVLASLRTLPDWVTGDNEPYAMDQIDFTIPTHAVGRGLDYLELEVRQDLLQDPAMRERVADLLADLLPACLID